MYFSTKILEGEQQTLLTIPQHPKAVVVAMT